jgi:hypothetical protein
VLVALASSTQCSVVGFAHGSYRNLFVFSVEEPHMTIESLVQHGEETLLGDAFRRFTLGTYFRSARVAASSAFLTGQLVIRRHAETCCGVLERGRTCGGASVRAAFTR